MVANDVWQGMSFEKWGDLSVGIASSVKNKRRLGRRDPASFGLWDTPQEWQVPSIGYLAHETTAQHFAGKISNWGRFMQLKPAPGRSYWERASTTGRRL